MLCSLPPEILAEIFFWALPDAALVEDFDGCPEPWQKSDVPLNVSQTCREWRAVAFSLPHIWSSIFVDIDDKSKVTPSLALINLWLRRSVNQPLFLGLSVHEKADVSNEIHKVLTQFTRHLQRWRCLHLYIPCHIDSMSEALQLGMNASAPWLRTLDTDMADQHLALTSVSPILPSLTKLHLYNILQVFDVREWLTLCPNLVEFQFEAIGELEDYEAQPIVHHALRSLAIKNAYMDLDQFFGLLSTPALEALSISCFASQKISFRTGLGKLLGRCSLKKLSLDDTSIDEVTLIMLLRASPGLQHLEITWNEEPCVRETLLIELTLSTGNLCPRLESMSFGAGTVEASDGIVSRMVRSRRPFTHFDGAQGHEKIQLLKLELGDRDWLKDHRDDALAFDVLLQGGLNIIIGLDNLTEDLSAWIDVVTTQFDCGAW
ncbi:hypothetical protein C8J56DRAFT_472620 [Mycena floridula]|nr:hypothetical protein C8J56DRAFT_472620 [Mycena floridula]